MRTLLLSGLTSFFALREPVVIERGCRTTVASLGPTTHTQDEIKAFANDALIQRFNTDIQDTQLISESERGARTKEMAEFKTRSMSQRVLINSVKVDGSKLTIDADRVISVGVIRSALPLRLGELLRFWMVG